MEQYQRFSVDKILSLDESGFNRHMHRLFAWSPVGEPARHVVPTERGSNVTVCAIIGCSGVVACDVQKGSYNTTRLLDFIATWPIEMTRGKCLVLDNVSFHHSASVCTPHI